MLVLTSTIITFAFTPLLGDSTGIELWQLTFTTLSANSADDKLITFFLFFQGNRTWLFMQIVSNEDTLHKMSYPAFWENKKTHISICRLLNMLPRVLSVKESSCLYGRRYRSLLYILGHLIPYRLECWVKISANDIFECFSNRKTVFDISCKLSPKDNLCEISKPIFWEKYIKRLKWLIYFENLKYL